MTRMLIVLLIWIVGLGTAALAIVASPGWWVIAVVTLALAAMGTYDLTQKSHSILRNYPVLGHARFLLEKIRPEIQQYFVESSTDGMPFDRETRDLVYER
ncbi:FMN-binding glutamate synthase family protein, partial [Rhodococcus erythropolis]|nr:FMN-binding glutamate synthase family protein [Rhodococcus erythropolis]